jgi:hypothetical protein
VCEKKRQLIKITLPYTYTDENGQSFKKVKKCAAPGDALTIARYFNAGLNPQTFQVLAGIWPCISTPALKRWAIVI